MSEAVAGQDAVVSAIGGKTPCTRTGIEPGTARTIVKALREHGVRRLVVASAMGAGDSGEMAGPFYKRILVPTFLRGALKDRDGARSRANRYRVDRGPPGGFD
jgi:NAD(P)H-binding